jgi:hypothetical protein
MDNMNEMSFRIILLEVIDVILILNTELLQSFKSRMKNDEKEKEKEKEMNKESQADRDSHKRTHFSFLFVTGLSLSTGSPLITDT